jgi:hypothetical protein
MSESQLTNPVEKTAPLTDAQVGNAVANKFLNEVHTALTSSTADLTAMSAEDDAFRDIGNLQGDPQRQAVLNAVADKIDNHDPSLGILQASVERDKNGEITGFSFANPQQESAYEAKLDAYMQQGHTRAEAIAADGTNLFDVDIERGHFDVATNPNQPADSSSAAPTSGSSARPSDSSSAAPAAADTRQAAPDASNNAPQQEWVPVGTISIPG